MDIKFLVTTRSEAVTHLQNLGYQVIMIDGTVPNWEQKPGDLHYDHHKVNGAKIQLDEIPLSQFVGHDQESILSGNECYITTMVDADACVAAAAIILAEEGYYPVPNFEKLQAIAYDCDHLGVPEKLEHLADFAAKAVAAMKENGNKFVEILNLPQDRRSWTIEEKELFTSRCFEACTLQLVQACLGKVPFPGEQGEADTYFAKQDLLLQDLIKEERVSLISNCLVFNAVGLEGIYQDPRTWIKAAKHFYGDLDRLSPITLTCRQIVIEGEVKGNSYTLGNVPLHEELDYLDYNKLGVYEALSKLEAEKLQPVLINVNTEDFVDLLDIEISPPKWGGRATVGGSDWKIPSALSSIEVVNVILDLLDN